MFSVPRDQASGECRSTSIGPTVAATWPLVLLRPRHLPDGAAQVPRIAEVHGRNRRNRPRYNLLRIDLHPQRQPHQDGQLGARVKSAHILRGIGLGIALGLRLRQHRRILRALLHLAQDKVAGAVQNAFNALDPVPGQSHVQGLESPESLLPQRRHISDARLWPRPAVPVPRRGYAISFLLAVTTLLPASSALPHPAAGRIEPARQFHNHIHIGGQHSVGVLAPHHARREPNPPASAPRRD